MGTALLGLGALAYLGIGWLREKLHREPTREEALDALRPYLTALREHGIVLHESRQIATTVPDSEIVTIVPSDVLANAKKYERFVRARVDGYCDGRK